MRLGASVSASLCLDRQATHNSPSRRPQLATASPPRPGPVDAGPWTNNNNDNNNGKGNGKGNGRPGNRNLSL